MTEAEIYQGLAELYSQLADLKKGQAQLYSQLADLKKGQAPSPTPNPAVTVPVITRRLSYSFEWLNMQVLGLAVTPKTGDKIYLLKDFWTTAYGSWERGQNPDKSQVEIESWAKTDYLKPFGAPDYFDDAGADHHLFGAVIGSDGKLKRDFPFRFWTPQYNGNEAKATTKHNSGWCNTAVSPDASFNPAGLQSGPWAWRPDMPLAEAIVGGGMPVVGAGKWHVSFFAVWVELTMPG